MGIERLEEVRQLAVRRGPPPQPDVDPGGLQTRLQMPGGIRPGNLTFGGQTASGIEKGLERHRANIGAAGLKGKRQEATR